MAPSIFLASATRSGSTHIANTLVRVGLRRASLHYGFEDHVNEDYTFDTTAAQILLPMGGFVFQSHARALGRNAPLLKHFDTPVVVTGRNIFDSLLSIKERTDVDWGRSAGCPLAFRNTTHLPLHLPGWGAMDDKDKFAWLVYNVLPWYLSFYASWQDADVRKLWVWYEEYFRDQPAGLEKILDYAEIPFRRDRVALESVSAPTDGKFSLGVSGRGMDSMSEAFVSKVLDQVMASRFPKEFLRRLVCSNDV